MKLLLQVFMLVALCNMSFAQKSASSSPNGELKAEKVQQNNNPMPEGKTLPNGMPSLNAAGDPEQNFYDYIKAKAKWFKENPKYLKDGVGITRVSWSFLEGMSEEIKSFVQKHKNQFEIIGQIKE